MKWLVVKCSESLNSKSGKGVGRSGADLLSPFVAWELRLGCHYNPALSLTCPGLVFVAPLSCAYIFSDVHQQPLHLPEFSEPLAYADNTILTVYYADNKVKEAAKCV